MGASETSVGVGGAGQPIRSEMAVFNLH